MKPKKDPVQGSTEAASGPVALDSTSTGNESSRLSVSVMTESSFAVDDKQPIQGVSTILESFLCDLFWQCRE